MIHAFTSSAPNYMGKVNALCRSLREHCPEMMIHWLVADTRNQDLLDNLDRESIDDVMFADDFHACREPGWLFKHGIVELSTAIKPEAALSLLGRSDCDLLLYFDPDMVVFSPLNDLVDQLRSASLVLTPHLLKPEDKHEAVLDHELCALRHGVFNLGFFGVRKCDEGVTFLKWWRERCREFCWGDWREGVFTDQKWINFAPIFFSDTTILRSPRFNVAPWNINQRCLEGTFDEGFLVDGEPLGFYHFTGFDSGAHRGVIDKYAGGNQAASSLVHWYEHWTEHLMPAAKIPWGLGTYENGKKIAEFHRKIYRQRVDLQSVFPNPFLTPKKEFSFLTWVTQTGPKEHPELCPVI
jgi:hypothetical protein